MAYQYDNVREDFIITGKNHCVKCPKMKYLSIFGPNAGK